ncbi:SCO family protein [Leucothrix pacifica]|uniref:SCO family protein n=1 Tax=Leucothrix pacifica TaxID=1247513 RepID=A0A317CPM6_9GAMM|nr:SCO family protein [Leucothrix pacifica]PWR00457.1 SCO family protein [Leucothrix pacifica]
MKQIIFILSVLAFIGGLVVAQQFLSNKQTAGESKMTPIAGKSFGGDFTLTPKDGKPVSLSDYRGKIVVLYFGYASCPDVCPTSLAVIGSAMRSLSDTELEDVQGLFVSVDPERDNGEKLQQYAAYFHEKFDGITGTPEEIQKVARQYGSYFAKVDTESAMSYLMDHTSTTFIIGRDGKFVSSQPHGANAAAIAEAIREALKG